MPDVTSCRKGLGFRRDWRPVVWGFTHLVLPEAEHGIVVHAEGAAHVTHELAIPELGPLEVSHARIVDHDVTRQAAALHGRRELATPAKFKGGPGTCHMHLEIRRTNS